MDRKFLENQSRAFNATIKWIESILGEEIANKENFRGALSSGEILCRLINAIHPGSIRRFNNCPNKARSADNLSLFLTACVERFGIPRSNLFSIDDFDDLSDRRIDAYPNDEKSIKCGEKVLVSLFWLAKYIDRSQMYDDLPKLDYSALVGFLPRTFIQSTLAFATGDTIVACRHVTKSLERTEQKLTSSHTGKFGEENMGNLGSLQSASTTETIEPSECNPTEPPLPNTAEQQINNNGTNDDWQEDLLNWREKRRRQSRMQATNMMTLQEIRQQEEHRHVEAIRDRVRELKTHRSFGVSSFDFSSDILRTAPSTSPGVALLTGSGSAFFESSGDVNSIHIPHTTPVVASLQDHVANADADATLQSKKSESETTIVPPNSPLKKPNSCEKSEQNHTLPQKSDDLKCPPINLTNETCDPVPESVGNSQDAREIRVRIPCSKFGEAYMGLTIRANGPSDTAPFVVDRVKIGSAADVYDLVKGDILTQLNGTNLRANVASIKLSELELMLDQLSLNNKMAEFRVLRQRDDDEFSDGSEADSQNFSMTQTERTTVPNTCNNLPSSSDIDEDCSFQNVSVVVRRSPTSCKPTECVVQSNGLVSNQSKSHHVSQQSKEEPTRRSADVSRFRPTNDQKLRSQPNYSPLNNTPVKMSLNARI